MTDHIAASQPDGGKMDRQLHSACTLSDSLPLRCYIVSVDSAMFHCLVNKRSLLHFLMSYTNTYVLWLFLTSHLQ